MYVENVSHFLFQLLKNGSKNKIVAFTFLFSVVFVFPSLCASSSLSSVSYIPASFPVFHVLVFDHFRLFIPDLVFACSLLNLLAFADCLSVYRPLLAK